MASAAADLVADPLPLQGPGLGNLTYTQAELFKPISMIKEEVDTGVGAGTGADVPKIPGAA